MAQTILNGHVLIPFPFNWDRGQSIDGKWSFANAIADSPVGTEDRAILRPNKRRAFSFTLRAQDQVGDMKAAEALRAGLIQTRAAVPFWPRPDAIAARDGNTVTLAPDCGRYAAGDMVLITDLATRAYTTRTIASQVDGVLTFTAAAPLTGDLLVPLVFGRLVSARPIGHGGAQSFVCDFRETPKPPTVAAEWLPTLANVYFLVTLDNSGSMDGDIAAVTAAADQLKTLLRDNVYGGDEEQADEFVRINTTDNERWLQWLAATVEDEQSSKYVCAAFINESQDNYHESPNVTEEEPTFDFTEDYAAYAAEFARCDLRIGSVYSIRSLPPQPDFPYFQTHLANALAGANGYAALGPALQTMRVRGYRNVPSGQPPVYYLAQILSLIEVFL